jgi:hypothetical protein
MRPTVLGAGRRRPDLGVKGGYKVTDFLPDHDHGSLCQLGRSKSHRGNDLPSWRGRLSGQPSVRVTRGV